MVRWRREFEVYNITTPASHEWYRKVLKVKKLYNRGILLIRNWNKPRSRDERSYLSVSWSDACHWMHGCLLVPVKKLCSFRKNIHFQLKLLYRLPISRLNKKHFRIKYLCSPFEIHVRSSTQINSGDLFRFQRAKRKHRSWGSFVAKFVYDNWFITIILKSGSSWINLLTKLTI